MAWVKDMKEAEELVVRGYLCVSLCFLNTRVLFLMHVGYALGSVQSNPNKWTETCWRALFYSFLAAYTLYNCWGNSWVFSVRAS